MGYQSAQQHGHKHGEAFMLMWYECRTCPHKERIWNSRDGVTPFGMGCPSCGGMLEHMHWGSDVYSPEHKLHQRQRFWRDGTPDEAEAIMRRRIESMRDEYPLSKDDEEKLITSVRAGEEGEFRRGWPMLGESGD